MTVETTTGRQTLDLHVPTLARVEGEGALHVTVVDGRLDDLRLEIYEPPRFFEALLRGRDYTEPIDITSRICGICPVAYQMSAAQSIERIIGAEPDDVVHDLRRLLYCGEWIESHVLHIGLLHAPDFLGAPSALDLAATHRELVETILEVKRVGNDLMEVVAGRPIHPINVRLAGFHRFPGEAELRELDDRLAWAFDAAVELVRWTATFDFPDVSVDHELVCLQHPDEYAICRGRLVSDRGLDIAIDDYDDEFVEVHREHSTALHSVRRDGRPYLTGPLARWANNRHQTTPVVRELAAEVGVDGVVRNPFRSVLVRGLEVVWALEEARRLIDRYVAPSAPVPVPPPRAGTAWGASEAPRGVLLHRYTLDDDGGVVDARIVPPTAQNQGAIELDVRVVVEEAIAQGLLDPDRPDAEQHRDRLRHRCETAIRNHDPCISCATHFLDLRVDA